MEKIDTSAVSLLGSSLFQKPEPRKTNEKDELKRRPRFSEIYKDAIASSELGPLKILPASEEALTELMDDVHSSGSDLIDRPFHAEILKYKKAVRNFVNYVVENGFAVETSQTNSRVLKGLRPHVQIKVIDQELEKFAAEILSGQMNKLRMVAKLDEISGLLVDLTISGVIKENNERRREL